MFDESQHSSVQDRSKFRDIPRKKLLFEPGKPKPKTLGDAIVFLESAQFTPEQEFYEFEIDVNESPIQAHDIRKLTEFPFEFQLLERNGKIVVSTGTKEEPYGKEQDIDERNNAKLYLHTHSSSQDDKCQYSVDSPSFADLSISTQEKIQHILATPNVLMIFRRPIYNPLTKMPSLDDSREILLHYCKAKGLDITGSGKKEGLRSFFDLTYREQAEVERQFTEDTKMIIKEASWDDEKAITEIMDIINLKKQIDPGYPIIPSCLDDLDLASLGDSQQTNIESLGGLIDSIINKYGIFAYGPSEAEPFIIFLKNSITNKLAEGAVGEYRKYLEELLLKTEELAKEK